MRARTERLGCCVSAEMQFVLGRTADPQCVRLDLPPHLHPFILLINCHTGLSNRIRNRWWTAQPGLQEAQRTAELQVCQSTALLAAQKHASRSALHTFCVFCCYFFFLKSYCGVLHRQAIHDSHRGGGGGVQEIKEFKSSKEKKHQ